MNREHVKNIAIKQVESAGLINLTRQSVCDQAGIPDGSFPHVMGCTFAELVQELSKEGHFSPQTRTIKKRANPTLRKASILNAAVTLARTRGYLKITRDQVAEEAGVSGGLVTRYFGTIAQLRRDVMRHAIDQHVYEVIAQGLVVGDKNAKKAPQEVKQAALTFLTN